MSYRAESIDRCPLCDKRHSLGGNPLYSKPQFVSENEHVYVPEHLWTIHDKHHDQSCGAPTICRWAYPLSRDQGSFWQARTSRDLVARESNNVFDVEAYWREESKNGCGIAKGQKRCHNERLITLHKGANKPTLNNRPLIMIWSYDRACSCATRQGLLYWLSSHRCQGLSIGIICNKVILPAYKKNYYIFWQ